MRAIFISYRRDDSEGEAGRLFDDLVGRFGESSVFMDVAGIQPGRDFRKAIDESVATCGVLLAVIGKGWLDAKDEAGKRRLDNPMDFVRLETASALKRDIPVVPVLVHGAKMPSPDQLPDDLRDLAFRNCCEVTHARWNSDVQLLVKALSPYVETVPAQGGQTGAAAQPARSPATSQPQTVALPPAPKSFSGLLIAIALVLVAAVGLAAYLLRPKPTISVPATWIDGFVKASEGPSLVGLEQYFDTTVSPYFSLPQATWIDVANDKKAYFARFPEIQYTLIAPPAERKLPGGSEILDFDLHYHNTRTDGTQAEGKTHLSAEVKLIAGQWKIVGIGEQLAK